MLSVSSTIKILLCDQPVDLCRSFDGLAAIARDGLGHDPLTGDWFVFRNRRGDRIKILLWDVDMLLLIYKRSGPDRILASLRGYLHADGYGGYDDYVISSAVRNDLNPWAYLNDLFCRLPDLGEAPTRERRPRSRDRSGRLRRAPLRACAGTGVRVCAAQLTARRLRAPLNPKERRQPGLQYPDEPNF